MKQDQLYAKFNPQLDAFRFDEQVVEVFDDMIERSVPGYRTILAMLTPLATRYATPKSHIYDLGCSLGASSTVLCAAPQALGGGYQMTHFPLPGG